MKRKISIIFNLIIIGSMMLAAWPVPRASAAPAAGNEGAVKAAEVTSSVPETKVTTAMDDVFKRIDPELRDKARAGGSALVKIAALVEPGTDLSLYFEKFLVRPGAKFDRIIGMVRADRLVKVASAAGTLAVLNMDERPAPDIQTPVATVEGESDPEPLTFSLSNAQPVEFQSVPQARTANNKPVTPNSFFTQDTNGVAATWAAGITGDGDGYEADHDPLKMGIVDTGIDFANPDLIGTQARIYSSTSPYFVPELDYGWPIAFDDRSMSDFALDNQDARGNWGWYMNAYLEVVDPDLGSTAPFTFDATDPATDAVVTFTVSTAVQTVPGNTGAYRFGWHPDDKLKAAFGHEIGVLVLHSDIGGSWGPYNSVLIDMSGADDSIFDQYDAVSYIGYEATGVNVGWSANPTVYDLSGGMVYYISNGTTPVPASDWIYGLGNPAPGVVVAFMINDTTEGGGNHGTLCAGTAIGQGYIDMMPYAGTYGSTYWPPTWYNPATEAINIGPAKDASMVALGNYYQGGSTLNFYDFAALGYDGLAAGEVGDNYDQPHMISNSYGSGATNNDGWDLGSRYQTLINYGYIAQYDKLLVEGGDWTPLFFKSSGNSGFGYGTVNTPMPESAVVAGASSMYGQFNLGDTALFRDWVNWGQLTGMSDRGPTSMSTLGMHVLTNGMFGSGNTALNEQFSGERSVNYWSGTSRSSPEAMSITGLIYDAYFEENGVYPGWREGRALLMNGARTAYNDPFAQGAGLANAFNAVEIIQGARGVGVTSSEGNGFWVTGSYRGEELASFARGLFPGETDTETFTITNYSNDVQDVTLENVSLQSFHTLEWDFTTLPLNGVGAAGEGTGTRYYDRRLYGPAGSNPGFGGSDPLFLAGQDDMLLQSADLMVVRMSYPFSQFQNAATTTGNWWFMYAWAWRDGPGAVAGSWFNDLNGNHVRNTGEFEPVSELVRMIYDYHGNTAEIRIREPWKLLHGEVGPNEPSLAAMNDILISFRHYGFNAAFNTTDMKVTVELYSEQPWEQLQLSTDTATVPANSSTTFDVTAVTSFAGPVVFSDNFDSYTVPALGAWTVVDTTGTCTNWASNAGRNYPSGNAHSTPNTARFNSYSCSSGATRLESPVIDLSAVAGAELSFWMYHDTGFATANDRVQLQVSVDGGAWTDIGTPIPRYLAASNAWSEHKVDLGGYAGSPNIRLGFLGTSAYGNDIYLDDISLQEMVFDAPGEYAGYIKVSYTDPYEYSEYIPVQKQVWFPIEVDPTLGGTDENTLYQNGAMFGATGTAAAQRAESGDWRFFYTDIFDEAGPGKFLLAHTTWDEDPAVVVPPMATDIDTLLFAPVPNAGLFTGQEGIIGPQGLEVRGGSTRAGSGPAWAYNTTSGGPDDWSSVAIAEDGLYGVAAQTVRWGGNATVMPYQINVGTAEVTPLVRFDGFTCETCTKPVTFKTNHADLAGGTLEVLGYGWSQPVRGSALIAQDDVIIIPYTVTATDAYKLTFFTSLPLPGYDIDLEVYRNGVLVGSSGGSSSEEAVTLVNPLAGDYEMYVIGYSVPAPETFTYGIDEVSGAGNITLTGIPDSIVLGQTYTMQLGVANVPNEAGIWAGTLFLGPAGAPYAIEISVIINQGSAVKEASVAQVAGGESLTYTITLTEQPMGQVAWRLEDVIPAGFEVLTVTGADYDPGTGMVTWNNIACTMPWIDATDGTALVLGGDDGEANVSLPAAFDFYGLNSTDLRVGNNGGILFGVTTGDISFSNATLASATVNNFIAPFWDDLALAGTPGGVYFKTVGTEPNRQYVVEYANLPHYGGANGATFEMILDEATQDVWFLYDDVDQGSTSYNGGAGATIGLRGASGTEVTQHSYNTASVTDNYAIQFTRDSATAYTKAYAGQNCAGENFGEHVITIEVQATGDVLGTITNTAHIFTGDNDCTTSADVEVVGAVPTWTKTVQINTGAPVAWTGMPFLVNAGDTVTVVDQVSVDYGADPIDFTLNETYSTIFDLVSATASTGTVVENPGEVVWTITGGVSNTLYTLTKVFTVLDTGAFTGSVNEMLSVTGGPAPEHRTINFEIPVLLRKTAPAEAVFGEVFTYTIEILAADPLNNQTAILTDVIPEGLEVVGVPTASFGTVGYDPGTRTVTWSHSPKNQPVPAAPVQPVKSGPADAKSAVGLAVPAPEKPLGTTIELTEGFEGGAIPPAGWTTVSNSTSTRKWTTVAAATYPTFVRTGAYAGWVNYDATANQDEWLYSPVLDLSGYDTATLDFWALSDTEYPTATMKVIVTDAAGTPIATLWDMVEDETWTTFMYRQVTLDLTPYKGQPIKIAWQYVGIDGDSFGLDDITVSGFVPDITTVTITFDVKVMSTGDFTNVAYLNLDGWTVNASAFTSVPDLMIWLPQVRRQ